MTVDRADLIDHHNSIVRRASVRSLELEDAMTALLIPVFDEVADEAARNFAALAGMATVTASTPGVTSLSTMICLMPREEQQAALAVPGGETPEDIHCTLCFLGEYEGSLEKLSQTLQGVAASHAPLVGEVGGRATFSDNGNGPPSILLPDVPGLVEMRVDVTKALHAAGIDYMRNHGFTPHLTLGYGIDTPGEEVLGHDLNFDHLMIVRGNVERHRLPLTGGKPLTAAGSQGIVDEIVKVAEAHQPEGGYGETAWNPETATVLWCAADWTSGEELEAAEAAFLGIEGVKLVEYEFEAMPTGWCDPAVQYVFGGNPFHCEEHEEASDEEEVFNRIEATFIYRPDPAVGFMQKVESQFLNGGGVGHVPASAHYRPAPSAAHACATCSFYGAGMYFRCGMYDTAVKPDYVCDEWAEGLTDAVPREEGWGKDDVLPSLVAASEPPTWTQPASSDLVDVDALVEKLRAAMDPVREKVVQNVMKTAIETAPIPPPAPTPDEPKNVVSIVAASRKKAPPVGISYDVTNPIVQQQIKSSGKQITAIAESTRKKVASVIGKSYAAGLSIDHATENLRTTMKSLSPARARLIARTELAGAVNGGSLAATQILDDAIPGGLSVLKVWLTAPGAPNPRHETYPELDGQTQQLDAPFDVGGQPLQYPGDPAGDPGEVCNCRCAISYSQAGQEIAQATAEDALDPEQLLLDAAEGESGVVAGEADFTEPAVKDEAAAASDVAADLPIEEAAAYADPITDGPATKKLSKLYDKWGRSLTEEQDDALQSYAENTFQPVNKFLRTGKADQDYGRASIEAYVKDIDDAIAKAPPIDVALDVKVYRGVTNVSRMLGTNISVGDSFTEPAFMSTTTNEKLAADFALGRLWGATKGKAMFEIIVPRGTRGAWMPSTFGRSIREEELLLDRGQTYTVTGIRTEAAADGEGRMQVITLRMEAPTAAEDLGLSVDQPLISDLPKKAKILDKPTEARPYGHLKTSSLDRRIEATRRAMRNVLAKDEMNGIDRYRYERWEEDLKAALRERELRSGVAAKRPYANVADEDLQKLKESAEAQIKETRGRAAKYEAKLTLEDIEAEIKHRADTLSPFPARGAKLRGEVKPTREEKRAAAAAEKKAAAKPGAKAVTKEQPKKAAPARTTRQRIAASRPRATRVKTVRAPYKAPKVARNARMKRLQTVYKQRYDAIRVERGKFSLADDAAQLDLDTIKATGADFQAEVTERMGVALKKMSKSKTSGELTRRDVIALRRDTITQVLSEIRPLNAPLDGISPFSDPRATAWLRNAAKLFPKDWGQFLGDTRLDVTRIEGVSNVQFMEGATRAVISLDNHPFGTAVEEAQGLRVSLHELSHVFEKAVPGISAREAEYFAERTAGEASKRLAAASRSGRQVFVREDKWVHPYMGRDYGPTARAGSKEVLPEGTPFEILSMGMEGLFTGSFPIWESDPETAQFILGLLVSL